MIYIITALQCEAIPFIEKLSLKQTSAKGPFRIYENDFVRLVVSGTGGISALEAVVHMLTKFKAADKDIVLNCGVCAVRSEISDLRGNIFSISSVRNILFKRDLYPDMTFTAHFPQAALFTLAKPYTKQDILSEDIPEQYPGRPVLLDMEGAFVFEGASRFVPLKNIHIFKIVSDNGANKIDPADVSASIASHMPEILRFLYSVQEYAEGIDKAALEHEEEECAGKIAENLRLTVYQKTEFIKLLTNYSVRKKDVSALLNKYKNSKAVNREERNQRYADIRNELTEP